MKREEGVAEIVSYGVYVPGYRLKRKVIFEAMGWLNHATMTHARVKSPCQDCGQEPQ